jgi:hypothetical protein
LARQGGSAQAPYPREGFRHLARQRVSAPGPAVKGFGAWPGRGFRRRRLAPGKGFGTWPGRGFGTWPPNGGRVSLQWGWVSAPRGFGTWPGRGVRCRRLAPGKGFSTSLRAASNSPRCDARRGIPLLCSWQNSPRWRTYPSAVDRRSSSPLAQGRAAHRALRSAAPSRPPTESSIAGAACR